MAEVKKTPVRRLVFQREDKKWAWHLKVKGRIVCTDGGQGYENEADAPKMADRIISGEFRDAETFRRALPQEDV